MSHNWRNIPIELIKAEKGEAKAQACHKPCSQQASAENWVALHDVSVKWCLIQKREGGRIESRCSHLRRCKYFDCVVLFRERSSRRKVSGPSPFGVTSRIFCLDGFGISVRSYRYV